MSASDTGRHVNLSDIIDGAVGPAVSPENMEIDDRADRVQLLKAQIKAGTYRADIKDIAMQLAAAMDPLM